MGADFCAKEHGKENIINFGGCQEENFQKEKACQYGESAAGKACIRGVGRIEVDGTAVGGQPDSGGLCGRGGVCEEASRNG